MKNKLLKTIDYRLKTKQGFVSLFAVLMSLVILAITIGISTVAFKENVLAFSAREGSYAFFAADTGLECALYHDSEGVFSDLLNGISSPAVSNFDCADFAPATTIPSGSSIVNFKIENLNMAGRDRCVEVSVDKDAQMPDPVTPGNFISATKIYSNGFNINCADVLNASSNRVVNRLLIATYPNPVVVPPVGP
jgi:Tfp pilus assembly protein PilX